MLNWLQVMENRLDSFGLVPADIGAIEKQITDLKVFDVCCFMLEELLLLLLLLLVVVVCLLLLLLMLLLICSTTATTTTMSKNHMKMYTGVVI